MPKLAATMHRAGNNLDAAERRMWSASVLGKYWALQLPEAALVVVILLLLQAWLGFPTWLTWSLVGLWVTKDAAFYPFVWRSYDPGYPATLHSLDGEHGVATERLDRSGYVRVRGELWRAELDRGARPVDKDEPVQVQATRGLTVIVAAVADVRES
ncbi:MAG: NfeD family protein [Gammaproteobacteria bacterium]|nr:NfeD family protein [Gammaproteobacteria bacterium]